MLLVQVGCRSCETQAPWMTLRVFPQVCCLVWYPNLPRPVASSPSPSTECDGRSSIITAQRTSHRAVGVHILDLDSTQVRRPTTAVRSLSQRVPPKCFPSDFPDRMAIFLMDMNRSPNEEVVTMGCILEGSRTRSIRMSNKIRDNQPDSYHQDDHQWCTDGMALVFHTDTEE